MAINWRFRNDPNGVYIALIMKSVEVRNGIIFKRKSLTRLGFSKEYNSPEEIEELFNTVHSIVLENELYKKNHYGYSYPIILETLRKKAPGVMYDNYGTGYNEAANDLEGYEKVIDLGYDPLSEAILKMV